MKGLRVECVGGVVTDDLGRILLIRRGTEPSRGCWSVPGGRVEAGETFAEATVREVREETGLDVVVGTLLGVVEREGLNGATYVIHDFVCTPRAQPDLHAIRAGDDADEVGWFTATQLQGMECVPRLLEALTAWGVLPAPTSSTSGSQVSRARTQGH